MFSLYNEKTELGNITRIWKRSFSVQRGRSFSLEWAARLKLLMSYLSSAPDLPGLLMSLELAVLSASSYRAGLTSSPEETTAAVMF